MRSSPGAARSADPLKTLLKKLAGTAAVAEYLYPRCCSRSSSTCSTSRSAASSRRTGARGAEVGALQLRGDDRRGVGHRLRPDRALAADVEVGLRLAAFAALPPLPHARCRRRCSPRKGTATAGPPSGPAPRRS